MPGRYRKVKRRLVGYRIAKNVCRNIGKERLLQKGTVEKQWRRIANKQSFKDK
jgi:hypothetical protein